MIWTSFILVGTVAPGILLDKFYLLAVFYDLADIKGDNILFDAIPNEDEEVERIISADPPKIIGEFELDGEKHLILASQPIPHNWTWDTPHHLAELMCFTLIDLSQGRFLLLTTSFSISANDV